MKIGIIGTGVFGIAIASILHKNGNDITMWTKFEDELNDLKNNRIRNNLNNYIISDDIKFKVVEQVKEYCKNNNYEIITVDGVRCEFDDSWALVRASNTGPNITARFEAKTEERLEEIQKEFTDLLNSLINKIKNTRIKRVFFI